MDRYQLITADIMNWLNLASRYNYRQSYYHAMLLDPPYHLTSVVKRFGKGEPKHTKTYADIVGRKTPIGRLAKGFMGQTWDGGDLAFNPELWAALKDMLLPGAFCFAFAGSRGWHRMATAIEDAGFIMHPTLFLWAYGSGFPKATRIDTQIDKHGGQNISWFGKWLREWREENGISQKEIAKLFPSKTGKLTGCVANWELGLNMPTAKQYSKIVEHFNLPFKTIQEAEREITGKIITNKTVYQAIGEANTSGEINITTPTTPEAAQWEGHRYGLQAMKPAVEPILCFQKPYEGRPLDNIVKTGAGALNIDGGRIGTNKRVPGSISQEKPNANIYGTYGIETGNEDGHNPNIGRWPSNLILSHHPDCKRAGVKRIKGSGNPYHRTDKNYDGKKGEVDNAPNSSLPTTAYADPDGLETVTDWQCVEGCPVKKLDLQSGDVGGRWGNSKGGAGWFSQSGFGGQSESAEKYKGATVGGASRFFYQSHFAYEIAEQIAAANPVRYVAKAGNKERNAGLDKLPLSSPKIGDDGQTYQGLSNSKNLVKNIHPTVKPIALTKYLASLLLPPDSYAPRRIIIPFFGSGSDGIGALLAGWDEVTGIEMTKKYIPIANARLAWWSNWLKWGQDDIDTILATQDDDRQLSFLEELD